MERKRSSRRATARFLDLHLSSAHDETRGTGAAYLAVRQEALDKVTKLKQDVDALKITMHRLKDRIGKPNG
jgi:hypothetical protein